MQTRVGTSSTTVRVDRGPDVGDAAQRVAWVLLVLGGLAVAGGLPTLVQAVADRLPLSVVAGDGAAAAVVVGVMLCRTGLSVLAAPGEVGERPARWWTAALLSAVVTGVALPALLVDPTGGEAVLLVAAALTHQVCLTLRRRRGA